MMHHIICFNTIGEAEKSNLKKFISDQQDLYNLFDKVLGFSKNINKKFILSEEFEQYQNLKEILLYADQFKKELLYDKISSIIRSFIKSLHGPAKQKTRYVYGILFNYKTEEEKDDNRTLKFLILQTIEQLLLSQKIDKESRKIFYEERKKDEIDRANVYRYVLFWYDKEDNQIKFIAKEKWHHTKGFTDWLKINIESLFYIVESFNIHLYGYVSPLEKMKTIIQLSEDFLYEELHLKKENITLSYKDNILFIKVGDNILPLKVERIIVYPIRYSLNSILELEDFLIKRKHDLAFPVYRYKKLRRELKGSIFGGSESLQDLRIAIGKKAITIKKPDLRNKDIIPLLSSSKDHIIFTEDLLRLSYNYLVTHRLKLMHLLEPIVDPNNNDSLTIANIDVYNKMEEQTYLQFKDLIDSINKAYEHTKDVNLKFLLKIFALDLVKEIFPEYNNFIKQLIHFSLNNGEVQKMFFFPSMGEHELIEYKRPDILYNKGESGLYTVLKNIFNKKLKNNKKQVIIIIGIDEQTHQPVVIESGYISEDIIFKVLEKIKNEEKIKINYHFIPVYGKYLVRKNNWFELSKDKKEGKILIIHIYKS